MSALWPCVWEEDPGFEKTESSQNSLVFLLASIFLFLFPLSATAAGPYPLQSDSPYNDNLESMKKGQETKSSGKSSPPHSQVLSTKQKAQDHTADKPTEKEAAIGPDAETWTLKVTSSGSGTWPVAGGTTITTKAIGTATLRIDRTGRLTGSGTISIAQTITIPPNPAIRFSPTTGQGPFTVTGKRDGSYLVISIDKGNIPLRGTMTVTMPDGTKTEPVDDSFDPSALVPTPATIDRKEGGASAIQISAGPITGTTNLALSGGINVAKDAPPQKAIFPKEKNIWTLELQLTGNWEIETREASGTGKHTLRGKVEFPLPLDDGPAKGEGPMTAMSSGTWTKPMAHRGSSSSKAVLILDGKIEKGILTFKPRAKMETAQITQGPPASSALVNFGEGLWMLDQEAEVSIPVKNGAETVDSTSPSIPDMKYVGKAIWRLTGRKVEHWLVTIDGVDHINPAPGSTPVVIPRPKGLKAHDPSLPLFKWSNAVGGLKVHWRTEIDVEIEDDNYKNGRGRSSFLSIDPFAQPPGVWECKSVSAPVHAEGGKKVNTPNIDKPTFIVRKGTKFGKQLDLDLYFPKLDGDVGYEVASKCRMNEKEAEKKIAYWKTEKNKPKKESLDKHAIAFDPRISVMLIDGWSRSKGDPESIDYEVITVKRIKSGS